MAGELGAGLLPEVVELIEKYDAFAGVPRRHPAVFGRRPAGPGDFCRRQKAAPGLMGLTDFLAEQTEALGVVIERP